MTLLNQTQTKIPSFVKLKNTCCSAMPVHLSREQRNVWLSLSRVVLLPLCRSFEESLLITTGAPEPKTWNSGKP